MFLKFPMQSITESSGKFMSQREPPVIRALPKAFEEAGKQNIHGLSLSFWNQNMSNFG